ncbi:hypothetical protein EXT48_21655 [Pseudoalteromonas sp. CO348]|uniref:alpha/beta hydrolase-fold protein n=1 Tax=Pseudoalteromonas sp. CO348 TaxID=1777271 RepID=UPI001023437E|nr:alpha/beta hydrolase-fold protein [Pseudoalteromonas sp. CO348]RZF98663.1 hypothetical protein EXT48_21655 [Pseudoalteromonas sp. CO348]
MRKLLFFLCALISLSAFAEDIVIGKRHEIESKVLNESREYWVSLPTSYKAKGYKKYPVLYFTDANLNSFFHAFSGIAKQMSSDASPETPEMILVGIVSQNRGRDSSPTKSLIQWGGSVSKSQETTGGADNFLKFIQTELVPQIEQDYRTADYKILAGYSFTGLTVIHSLYQTPEFFNAYIAIDPSLWWDNQIMLKRYTEFSKKELNKRQLFVSTSERVPSLYPKENYVREFIHKLEASPIKGLTVHSKTFGTDQNHHTMPIMSFYLGLKNIFSGYMVDDAIRFRPAVELQEHFNIISEKLGVTLKPRESLVNFFGYNRLYDNQFPTDSQVAIDFFRLNTEYYPESSNAWDSLGEAYLFRKQYKLALDAYIKSRELSPENKNAEEKIKEIKEHLN